MYLIPDKSKLSNAGDLRASHPSMRRTMEPNQPVVHVEFSAFDTPSHMNRHPNDDDDNSHATHEETPSQRYVAGEQFYNYEMYGSLRKGNPVSFFSWQSVGLMAAVFSSVLSYQCLQSTVRPYMASQLNLKSTESQAVQRLVEVPMTLSFFIGLLMDAYPIRGLRRKGYMVLGLVIYVVAVLALGGLSMYFESTKERDQWLVILSILLISVASFGCIITYLCVHTRVIELAQREPLRRRGAIVADYLIFRGLTSYVGSGYAFFIFGWSGVADKVTSLGRIPFSTTMFILAFICTAPLPIILHYWKEEHYNLSTTLKVRGKIFWKIMQQKAVWRILMFIVVFTFFLTISFGDSANFISGWTGANLDNVQVVRYISDTIGILTILAWRTFFMNTLWPRFYCWAPILQVLPGVLVTILVCLDINQDRYVYRSIDSVTNISDTIRLLNPIVPLIEIIQEGSEGATVGLTLTLYRIVQVFVRTNTNGLFKGENFYNTTLAKEEDPDTRVEVMWTMMLVYAINLVALVGLFFLPSQKLDAQQLRMYGGFTKAASSAIVVFCLAFFLYSLSINIMTFIPATKCFGIVGAC